MPPIMSESQWTPAITRQITDKIVAPASIHPHFLLIKKVQKTTENKKVVCTEGNEGALSTNIGFKLSAENGRSRGKKYMIVSVIMTRLIIARRIKNTR